MDHQITHWRHKWVGLNFGDFMQRPNSLKKALMLAKVEERENEDN